MSNKKMKMNEDTISLLPDHLLHDILSFLDTKQVVQTCVLSKRWKTVWTCIPTLNFDFYSYWFKGQTRNTRLKQESLRQFVLNVLSRHCGAHIQKLSYTSLSSYDQRTLADSLMPFARRRMVQELCIDAHFKTYNDSKWLSVGFHSLTVLKISRWFMIDWGFIFAACPNLESLVLDKFHSKTLSVCGPKLKNLELYGFLHRSLAFLEVELFTPNLRCVKFKNLLPSMKCDLDLSYLDKVNIAIEEDYFISEYLNMEAIARDLFKFLQVFHNARSLTMPLKGIEVALSVPASLSDGFLFHNLRHLKLKIEDTSNMIHFPISLLTYLRNCPKLESLLVDLNQD